MQLDIDAQLEAARAQFEEQRTALADLGGQLGELTIATTSPDNAVTITMSGNGEVTDIDFTGSAYRSMAPAELGELLVRTIADARSAYLDEVIELMPESPIGGVSTADLVRGDVDVADLLPSGLIDADFSFTPPGASGRPR